MHDFVVREGQHKIFAPGIQQAEGHQIVVIFTIDRIVLHVVEGVVHPAHIPLEVEAQAAIVRWQGDAGKVSGLFSHTDAAGVLLSQSSVGIAQELDGLQILVSAVAVGNPFARGAL